MILAFPATCQDREGWERDFFADAGSPGSADRRTKFYLFYYEMS
jgi:hypothetical protein